MLETVKCGDLNDISDADLDYVHRRCGEPWGPWTVLPSYNR
jgi:hypothetical protein